VHSPTLPGLAGMFALREFGESQRDDWNAFISSRRQPEIIQSWEWGDAKSGFPVWTVKRLGWERGGKLVASAQILRRTLPLGFSLAYVPRGPMMDWDDTELVHQVVTDLITWIRGDAFGARSILLRIEPPAAHSEATRRALVAAGLRPYFKTVQPTRTLFIDLDRTPEQLLGSFRRTARNLIRRCEKEGIRVEVHRGTAIDTHLREFYGIYAETARRAAFATRPLRHFQLVTARFAPRDMLRLYRCVAPDGRVLASGLVTVLGSRAWYIWGGSTRDHPLAKFASYGYMWGMLSDLRRAGVTVFDFWGLAPEEAPADRLSTTPGAAPREHPWAGFTLFKTAFGGEPFDYAPAYDLPLSPLYLVFRYVDRKMTPPQRATSG
jgi:lipid II:glycine glycyltransferase (peptidoglycan interpeptide bridge formation enzyme)